MKNFLILKLFFLRANTQAESSNHSPYLQARGTILCLLLLVPFLVNFVKKLLVFFSFVISSAERQIGEKYIFKLD